MAKQQQKYSFEVQGLSGDETLVPLSQASRLAELLAKMPIEIADAGSCRIEVNGSQIDIYGLDHALKQCRVTDSTVVKDISARSDRIEFELKGSSFSKIIVHTERVASKVSYQSTLVSSGESRVGYSPRASG